MSIDEIRKCTRRELSDLIDAMVSRKQGYQDAEEPAKIEATDEVKRKIAEARKKRFGEGSKEWQDKQSQSKSQATSQT